MQGFQCNYLTSEIIKSNKVAPVLRDTLPVSHIYPKHDFVQEWTDVNLKWNESEYGMVKDIRMPPSNLWKPDILMYNRWVWITYHKFIILFLFPDISASESFDGTYQTNVVVTSTGTCTYIPPGIFKSSCQIGIYALLL